mgnify:CR=1 FL=1
MKLTKHQKKYIKDIKYDIVSYEVDKKESNVASISFFPEDGDLYYQICDHFNLSGHHNNVKLLIIATQEGDRGDFV